MNKFSFPSSNIVIFSMSTFRYSSLFYWFHKIDIFHLRHFHYELRKIVFDFWMNSNIKMFLQYLLISFVDFGLLFISFYIRKISKCSENLDLKRLHFIVANNSIRIDMGVSAHEFDWFTFKRIALLNLCCYIIIFIFNNNTYVKEKR